MLSASLFIYQYRTVQPDPPTRLAMCLPKRLCGTGCSDYLVDILSTLHSAAGFPCNQRHCSYTGSSLDTQLTPASPFCIFGVVLYPCKSSLLVSDFYVVAATV